MQYKLNKFTVALGLLVVSTASYAAPQQPNLAVTVEQAKVTAKWNTVEGATAYTLFYAPHPALTPIKSIPMGENTTFTAELSEGMSYAVAIKANDLSGESPFSNIKIVRILKPTLTKTKRTGQTKSYDNSEVITNWSIKDDGFYQTGIKQSYTRNDDKEVVTDLITGLMWQDDIEAKTIRKPWSITNNDDTSGDTTTTYCANLTLGGFNNWRMPTRSELVDLNNYSRSPLSINPEFKNTAGENLFYASSTTFTAVAWNGVWFNDFYNGCQMTEAKDFDYNIRCVREGKDKADAPKPADFTRNNGVVTDNNTGFQWQDDYNDNNGIIKMTDWVGAIDYCNALSLNGGNWRLPNMNEMLTLVDDTKFEPSTHQIFQNISIYVDSASEGTISWPSYWTSSTSGHLMDKYIARIIYLGEDGHQNITLKSDDVNVMCIR